MGVPTKAALNAVAFLGLEAAHCVLGITGDQVAIVGQTVSERRAVIENELVVSIAAGRTVFNAGAESVILLPVSQDFFLNAGQVRGSGNCLARAVKRIECVAVMRKVGHFAS